MKTKKAVSVFLLLTVPVFYIGFLAEEHKGMKMTLGQPESHKQFLVRPQPPTPTPTPDISIDEDEANRVLFYVLNQEEYTYYTIETEYLCRGYITAYCNCSKCCTYANQATASGVYPHYSEEWDEPTTCAIDPRYYRFGDLFMIDGKVYVAEDTGSAVKGNRWDLYQEDHSSVQSFDSHYSDVYRVTITEHKRKGLITYELIRHYLLDRSVRCGGYYRFDNRALH